jgi:hypothetical protein
LPKRVDVKLPADAAYAFPSWISGGIGDSLTKAGFNLRGVKLNVLAVGDTKTSMLVMDVDSAQATALTAALGNQADLRKFAAAITAAPEVKRANIVRLAVNIRQGADIITMTLTLQTLDGIAKGTIPDAELQKQIQFGQKKA